MIEKYDWSKYGVEQGDMTITEYSIIENGQRTSNSTGVEVELLNIGIGVRSSKHNAAIKNLEECLNMLDTILTLGGIEV